MKLLSHFFGRRRNKDTKQKKVAVIGLGVFGRSICKTLYENDVEVLAIDIDSELVTEMKDFSTDCVKLDVTNEEALKKFRLQEYDIVIVAIGERYQDNFLITAHLKEIGVKHVISRATSRINEKILLKIGADEVISPEEIVGTNLANRLTQHQIFEAIHLSEDFSLLEFQVPESLVGRDLSELPMLKYKIHLVLIRKSLGENNFEISLPRQDCKLSLNDVLVILGKNQDVEDFFENIKI